MVPKVAIPENDHHLRDQKKIDQRKYSHPPEGRFDDRAPFNPKLKVLKRDAQLPRKWT